MVLEHRMYMLDPDQHTGEVPVDGDWDLSFSVYHKGLVTAFRKS